MNFFNKDVIGFKDPNNKQQSNQSKESGATLFRRKKAKKMKTAGILVFSYLILALVLTLANVVNQNSPILFGGLILVLFISNFIWHMTERQYYSLPDSGSPSNHRCVFCGHRGIYRSTIYKTNTVRHTCSKCRIELYRRY